MIRQISQCFLHLLHVIFIQPAQYLFCLLTNHENYRSIEYQNRKRKVKCFSANNSAGDSIKSKLARKKSGSNHSYRKYDENHQTKVITRSTSNENESCSLPQKRGSIDSHIIVTPVQCKIFKRTSTTAENDLTQYTHQDQYFHPKRNWPCRPCCLPMYPVDAKLLSDEVNLFSANQSIKSNIDQSNDQNQSVFSFPDHEPPVSELSNLSQDNLHGIKSNAELLVEESMFAAQEKLNKISQKTNEIPLQKETKTNADQVRQIEETKTTDFCRELVDRLNISNKNQINRLLQLIASHAPELLVEKSDNSTNFCHELMMHPPFKPKRLIYLSPDGGIQVLSAVNDGKNFDLNYSNSANKSNETNVNRSASNEVSLAVELETSTTIDYRNDFIRLPIDNSFGTLSIDPLEFISAEQRPINRNQSDEQIISF